MDKVTIKLQGGLGNYLFQIAVTYSYAKEYNKTPLFSADKAIRVHKPINVYRDNILRKINFNGDINGTYKTYNEPKFSYSEIPNIDGSVFLDGYYQSEKYFSKYSDDIRDLFSITPELNEEISAKYRDILAGKTCSLHVRRGDYVRLSEHHPPCPISYYQSAMKLMPEDTKYLVFSDDMVWCKENLIGDNFIFIENNTDIFDLYVMSLCDNNIIANSSFSWWGAWLNNNVNKIVVAPSNWFGPAKKGLDTKDVYGEKWVKI